MLRIALAIVLALAVPVIALAWIHNGTPVCTATGAQADASMLTDGAGGCFITWDDARGGTPQIYAQHLDANGNATWTADGINVCSQAGNETLPQIVTDGAGGCIIVWQDTRSGSSIIYGQRLNASGATQWTSAGVALASYFGNQTKVAAVADGSGGVIATWDDTRTGLSETYCQRLGATGLAAWNATGVRALPASNPASDLGPRLDADGSGGAMIVAVIASSGASSPTTVIGQHMSSVGAVQWGTNGVTVTESSLSSPYTYNFVYPYAAGVLTDGSGGAYFTWTGSFNVNTATNTYAEMCNLARRLNGGGACVPGWTAAASASLAGTPLMVSAMQEDAGVSFSDAKVFPDGAGGAIFVTACQDRWANQQASPVGTINVSHAMANGVHDWTQVAEVPAWDAVFANSSSQKWRAAVDGSGGVVVGWQGNAGVGTDGLYALRFNRSGVVPGWASTGVLLADATGAPIAQSICNDGAGGAIVAYTRGGDIYAAAVASNGVASVANAPELRGVMALESVSPNPTRGGVHVALSIARPGAVRLELFDLQGRKLLGRDAGQLSAGRHDLELAPKAPLTAGVYEMRVTSGGTSRSARFVVER
jgi:hypothetical protein